MLQIFWLLVRGSLKRDLLLLQKGGFLNGHQSTEDSCRLETTVIVRMLEEFLYILEESL